MSTGRCAEVSLSRANPPEAYLLSGPIAALVQPDVRAWSEWQEVVIRELSVEPDHVHLVSSIPPKIAVLQYLGSLKGTLAIKLFRSYPGLKKNPYWGNHFWARGYFVTITGVDAEVVRRYGRYQEED